MLKVFDESSRDDLEILIDTLKNVAVKRGIPIDGLVMKYDSIAYSKQKGGTSHHNNDGIAFKFEDETADTVLQDIEWSLGRTVVDCPKITLMDNSFANNPKKSFIRNV